MPRHPRCPATTVRRPLLPALPVPLSWRRPGDGSQGDEQATAYGSTPAHCIVDGPTGTVGSQEQADVFCFDTSGNPLDTTYTMQWMVG